MIGVRYNILHSYNYMTSENLCIANKKTFYNCSIDKHFKIRYVLITARFNISPLHLTMLRVYTEKGDVYK